MADSFWTGGRKAYADGVKEHYQAELAELAARLEDCQDERQKRDIEQEIEAVKSELKGKLNGIDGQIF